MSVVAWDGKTLASDSAMTMGSSNVVNRCCKIGMLEPQKPIPLLGQLSLVLFGVVGAPEVITTVNQFLSGGADELELGKHAQVLIASPQGVWIWQYSAPVPIIQGAKAAIGIGAPAALAAMYAGVDAMRAVELACAVDANCDGPVQAFTLPAVQADPEPPIVLHEVQEPPE